MRQAAAKPSASHYRLWSASTESRYRTSILLRMIPWKASPERDKDLLSTSNPEFSFWSRRVSLVRPGTVQNVVIHTGLLSTASCMGHMKTHSGETPGTLPRLKYLCCSAGVPMDVVTSPTSQDDDARIPSPPRCSGFSSLCLCVLCSHGPASNGGRMCLVARFGMIRRSGTFKRVSRSKASRV